MIAKVKNNKHGGIPAGREGPCVPCEGGFEVTVEADYISLFGGENHKRTVTAFFTKDEVEVLPEPDFILGSPEEIKADEFINQIKNDKRTS